MVKVSNIKNLDDYRSLEKTILDRLECDKIAVVGLTDNTVVTFVSSEANDIELTYMIQSLKDRRNLTWMEANEII